MKECSHKTLFIYESNWQTGFGSHASLLTPVLGKYLEGPGLVIYSDRIPILPYMLLSSTDTCEFTVLKSIFQ